MDWRIPAVLLIIAVATVIFVVILRSNRARDERGHAEAEARGETIRKTTNLTVLYLVVGAAFLVAGAFMLLKP